MDKRKHQERRLCHHTCVFSRHFQSVDVNEPAQDGRRLKPGAVPVLLPWNNYSLRERRLELWERRDRPETMDWDTGDVDVACACSEIIIYQFNDVLVLYCQVPRLRNCKGFHHRRKKPSSPPTGETLEQAWPTRGSRAACGSLPRLMRLLRSYWIL